MPEFNELDLLMVDTIDENWKTLLFKYYTRVCVYLINSYSIIDSHVNIASTGIFFFIELKFVMSKWPLE